MDLLDFNEINLNDKIFLIHVNYFTNFKVNKKISKEEYYRLYNIVNKISSSTTPNSEKFKTANDDIIKGVLLFMSDKIEEALKVFSFNLININKSQDRNPDPNVYYNVLECLIKLKTHQNKTQYGDLLQEIEYRLRDKYNNLKINFLAKDFNQDDMLLYFYYNLATYYLKGYINDTNLFISQIMKLDIIYNNKVNFLIIVMKMKVLYAICLIKDSFAASNFNYFSQIQSAFKKSMIFDETSLKLNLIIADIYYFSRDYKNCNDTLDYCLEISNRLETSNDTTKNQLNFLELIINLKQFTLFLEFGTFSNCEPLFHRVKTSFQKLNTSTIRDEIKTPFLVQLISLIYRNNLEVYKYLFNIDITKLEELSIIVYEFETLLKEFEFDFSNIDNDNIRKLTPLLKNNLSCAFYLNGNIKEYSYILNSVFNLPIHHIGTYLANINLLNMNSIDNPKIKEHLMKLESITYKNFSEFKNEHGIFAFLYNRAVTKVYNFLMSKETTEEKVRKSSDDINRCIIIIKNFYFYYKISPYKTSDNILVYYKINYLDAYLMKLRNENIQSIKLIESLFKESLNENISEDCQELVLKLMKLNADNWFKIDVHKALDYYLALINKFKEFKFKPTIERGIVLTNIGICYFKFKNIQKCREYFYASKNYFENEIPDIDTRKKVYDLEEMIDKTTRLKSF